MADITSLSNLNSRIDKKALKEALINFIVPLVCIGVSLILFLIVIYPSFSKIPQLKQSLASTEKLRDTLKEKQTKINRLADFKSVLDEDSALIDKLLPSDQDVPGILDQIDQIARDSGLTVNRLSYSFGDSTTPAQTAAVLNTVLVTLGAEGNTGQMRAFLKNVEVAARVITVSNYRYNLANSNDKTTLSMVFTLNAPYMKVQSNAITDEPIKLDITDPAFVSFINMAKGLTFYKQLEPSQQSEARKAAQQSTESVQESTSSNQ